MDLDLILHAIKSQRIRITDHADEEAVADRLSFDEILDSVKSGEVIEEYVTDRPYPSCLILGKNELNEPIHTDWAR